MLVKLEWLGYRTVKKLWRYVKPFSYNTSVSRRDRHTDRQKDGQNCYINIARQWKTSPRHWRIITISINQSEQSTIADVYINISRTSSLQKSWKNHSIYATSPSPRMFSTYNKPLTQRTEFNNSAASPTFSNTYQQTLPHSTGDDLWRTIQATKYLAAAKISQRSTRQSTSSSLFQPWKPVAAIALTSHDGDAVSRIEHENNRQTRHIWTRYRHRVFDLAYFNDCDHSWLAVNMFSALKSC